MYASIKAKHPLSKMWDKMVFLHGDIYIDFTD